MNRQLAAVGWALYVSEVWYSLWEWGYHEPKHRRLYAKARAIVLFDRAMQRIMEADA